MRLATEDDLPTLAKFHVASFDEHWDEAALAELLASSGAFALVVDGGFILVRQAADEAEILTLAVPPSYRRKGLGRALVLAAADRAHAGGVARMFLEVGTANLAAHALYTSLGFGEAGRRPAYYRTPAGDALILKASLPLAAPALGNSGQTD